MKKLPGMQIDRRKNWRRIFLCLAWYLPHHVSLSILLEGESYKSLLPAKLSDTSLAAKDGTATLLLFAALPENFQPKPRARVRHVSTSWTEAPIGMGSAMPSPTIACIFPAAQSLLSRATGESHLSLSTPPTSLRVVIPNPAGRLRVVVYACRLVVCRRGHGFELYLGRTLGMEKGEGAADKGCVWYE